MSGQEKIMKTSYATRIKHARALTAMALLLFVSSLGARAQPNPQQTFVTTRDGVKIAVQEYGDPKGAETC